MQENGRLVTSIAVTPVRCFGLTHPEEVWLHRDVGVVENRRFFLVDETGNRLRSSVTYWPVVLTARYDAVAELLTVDFPDGTTAEGSALELGEEVSPTVGEDVVPSRIVEGPWTEGLSRLAGQKVRIARPARPGAAQEASLTLMSEESLDRLGQEAGRGVDGRRFRMLFTIRGVRAHGEDEWDGRLVRVGDAVIRVGGPVPRCALTDPEPGHGRARPRQLKVIKRYRGVRGGEAIDFGVYARVEEPGRVRVGDPVEPLG